MRTRGVVCGYGGVIRGRRRYIYTIPCASLWNKARQRRERKICSSGLCGDRGQITKSFVPEYVRWNFVFLFDVTHKRVQIYTPSSMDSTWRSRTISPDRCAAEICRSACGCSEGLGSCGELEHPCKEHHDHIARHNKQVDERGGAKW